MSTNGQSDDEAPSDAGAIEDPADVGMVNEVRSAAKQAPASDRINIDEPAERRYWANMFNVSEEKLKQAVEAVGPQAQSLRKYLGSVEPDSAQ